MVLDAHDNVAALGIHGGEARGVVVLGVRNDGRVKRRAQRLRLVVWDERRGRRRLLAEMVKGKRQFAAGVDVAAVGLQAVCRDERLGKVAADR